MPNQWTEDHCIIAVPDRICEIHEPQIIRRFNVFLICPVAHHLARFGFGGNDGAKVQTFSDMENFLRFFLKLPHMPPVLGSLTAPFTPSAPTCTTPSPTSSA